MYYLGSRYYNAEVGRFINADTTDVLGVSSDFYDKNLYSYCDNNPVSRADSDGEAWILAMAAVAGIVGEYVSNVVTGVVFDNESLMEAVKIQKEDIPGLLGAGFSGMISVMGMPAGAVTISNAIVNVTTYWADCKLSNKKVDAIELAINVGVGMHGDIKSKSLDGNRVRKAMKTANKYISNTQSNRKKAMYTAKKARQVMKVAKYNYKSAKSSVGASLVVGIFTKIGQGLRKLFG